MGGDVLPPVLGSSNMIINANPDGPSLSGLEVEEGISEQLKNRSLDPTHGDNSMNGDLFPVCSGLVEHDEAGEPLAEENRSSKLGVVQGTGRPSSVPITPEAEETIDLLPEELAVDGSNGLVLDQENSTVDGSAWPNGVPSTPFQSTLQVDDSGWTSADVVPPSAAPTVPEQASNPSKRRTYYMVKIPRFLDTNIKSKMKLAEIQMEEMNKKRDFYRAALQLKRASKSDLLDKLKPVRERERTCRDIIQGKRMEMEPYQSALNKFRNAFGTTREKGQDLCSSEEQLNERIAYLQHRIEHESIPLKEEKQLLREIKQLEATRGQVCANMILQAELIENLGPREEIQERCKLIGSDLDTMRKEHKLARAEVEAIEKDLESLNVALEELRQQVEKSNLAQKEAYELLKELWRQDNARNEEFYNYKRDIQAAKKAASEKDLDALEKLCHMQVEHVLALWSNETGFRAVYIENNERSTLRRLETLDGRALGPDEEPPLLACDIDTSSDSSRSYERAGPQTSINSGGRSKVSKVPDDEPKSIAKAGKPTTVHDSVSEVKPLKESKQIEEKGLEPVTPSKISTVVGKSKPQSHTESLEDNSKQEAEAAELKEKRRQEEMAKAKEAAERKRRLAEKNQSKALARAQKEAERKEKERAKRSRKKNAANAAAAGVDTNGDVASQAESHEVVAAPDEAFTISQVKEAEEDAKRGSGFRKKTVGKKPRAPRVAGKPPLSKKRAERFSFWIWVLLAAMTLVVLSITVGCIWWKL